MLLIIVACIETARELWTFNSMNQGWLLDQIFCVLTLFGRAFAAAFFFNLFVNRALDLEMIDWKPFWSFFDFRRMKQGILEFLIARFFWVEWGCFISEHLVLLGVQLHQLFEIRRLSRTFLIYLTGVRSLDLKVYGMIIILAIVANRWRSMDTTGASLVHIEASIVRVSLSHLCFVLVFNLNISQVAIYIVLLATTPIWLLVRPSAVFSLDVIWSFILTDPRRRFKRRTISVVFKLVFIVLVAFIFFLTLLKHNFRI